MYIANVKTLRMRVSEKRLSRKRKREQGKSNRVRSRQKDGGKRVCAAITTGAARG